MALIFYPGNGGKLAEEEFNPPYHYVTAVDYFEGNWSSNGGGWTTTLGAINEFYPVSFKSGGNRPYSGEPLIELVVDTSSKKYFKVVDEGSATVSEGSPAKDISPSQEFLIDSAKDVLSAGEAFLAGLAGQKALTSALSVIKSGAPIAMTVAKGAISRFAPVALGLLATQIALNYSKTALAKPASPISVSIKPRIRFVPYNPSTGETSVTPSSNNSLPRSGNPTIYDETAQYMNSYPAISGGNRHPVLSDMISRVSDMFLDAVSEGMSAIGQDLSDPEKVDLKNTDFWNDFVEALESVVDGQTDKRANNSTKNEANEYIKEMKLMTTALDNIHADLKYLANTMYDFSIGIDIDSILEKYFTIPIPDTILVKNIAKILDEKSFSSDILTLDGGSEFTYT